MGFSWGGEDGATWGGEDGSLWGSTPEGAYARLVNAAGAERILQPSTVVGGDAAREHSALSDYQLTVPYDESIEDWRFSTIYLYGQGEFLFVGEVLSIESDEARATTTLSGPGIGVTLERGDAVKTYQRVTIPGAIRDYLSTYSPIGGTVTDPATTSITDNELQTANTQADFERLFSPEETDPWEVDGDTIAVLQTCFHADPRNGTGDYLQGTAAEGGSDDYVDGFTAFLNDPSHSTTVTVTTPYTIPEEHVGVACRQGADDVPIVSWQLDGEEIDFSTEGFSLLSFGWDDVGDGIFNGTGWDGGDLEPGDHTITVDVTAAASGEQLALDWIVLYDQRFAYNFDNATDANDELAGPELYPDGAPIEAAVASASHRINAISISTSIDDTTDGQALAWSADDGGTWTETANTETITDQAVAEDTSTIIGRVKLGRYGSQTETPTSGVTGQVLSSWSLNVDGDTMPVAEDLTVDGNHLENLQRLHKRGNMRFVIGHAENEADWAIESFRRGDVAGTSDWVVENATRKRAVAEYANRIVGKGAKDENGDRIRVAETDTAEVTRLANDLGITEADATITRTFTDPSIENKGDLGVAVRSQLNHATGEDQNTGKLDVFPVLLDPGKTHTVDQWDGDEFDLERVVYRFGAGGQASGTLVFEEPEGLGEAISDTRQQTGEIRDSV